MSQLFSKQHFEENFRQHIEMNQDRSKVDAMNGYYRSVVSSLVQDQLTKNYEIIKRIQNLDEAYKKVKKED
ncbi:protein YvfG [Bacillus carboniphilus]|uniref:Protein YvfG n=1 Tax=Bacillus carboniphilus TaxID=86663 RepID=A0ABY9JQ29_9BACI|nr:protein YvfG [Bacillus carboniphilus]WLR41427.1 protein YvfG [Bacillus carboniphilus]